MCVCENEWLESSELLSTRPSQTTQLRANRCGMVSRVAVVGCFCVVRVKSRDRADPSLVMNKPSLT